MRKFVDVASSQYSSISTKYFNKREAYETLNKNSSASINL